MKEAKSVANGVFAFLVFLLCWALVAPGASHSKRGNARFLRMQVEEGGERHTFSVPTFVVHGFLRGASIGRFHREMDLNFDRDVPHETMREAWAELQKAPDGTDVKKDLDGDEATFRKEGTALTMSVKEKGDGETVTLRLPVSLVEMAMSEDRDLDAETIIAGLRSLGKGDLVDVRKGDTHVRIWLE